MRSSLHLKEYLREYLEELSEEAVEIVGDIVLVLNEAFVGGGEGEASTDGVVHVQHREVDVPGVRISHKSLSIGSDGEGSVLVEQPKHARSAGTSLEPHQQRRVRHVGVLSREVPEEHIAARGLIHGEVSRVSRRVTKGHLTRLTSPRGIARQVLRQEQGTTGTLLLRTGHDDQHQQRQQRQQQQRR